MLLTLLDRLRPHDRLNRCLRLAPQEMRRRYRDEMQRARLADIRAYFTGTGSTVRVVRFLLFAAFYVVLATLAAFGLLFGLVLVTAAQDLLHAHGYATIHTLLLQASPARLRELGSNLRSDLVDWTRNLAEMVSCLAIPMAASRCIPWDHERRTEQRWRQALDHGVLTEALRPYRSSSAEPVPSSMSIGEDPSD